MSFGKRAGSPSKRIILSEFLPNKHLRLSAFCGSLSRGLPCRRAQSERQISAQHFVQWLSSVDERVVAIVPLAAVAQAQAERFHLAQVALPYLRWAGEQFGDLFQAFEFDEAREGKLQFVRIEHVEHHHLVAAKPQVLDAVEHLLLVVKKVADENDDALAPKLAGHVVEDRGDARLRARLEGSELGDEL